ncbi:DUF7527 domain-containing protein [Haloarcula laminariae]|uniref:DUF7527 domain-containing protein n=1 Tax=Haloarcula laminariae TaxID=2961577 RepID=UPI0021C600E7|nr:hypothetical protein [Halomicroarcula laminariae]
MSMRTVELVSEWDSVPFDGGYAGLHSLSDQEFSGAVIAGPTQLFMLNGTVVGILDGDIEDFDGADGTARAAPHDALPLLVVMQDQAGDPRAQYYTEDTPITDVDQTLEDGNFTGYVELSENVLSGDYYLVYHQGHSMSVAWVGNSQRLITDEEAYEQADGEVGIYKVMPASIEPIDIPEPSSPADDGESTAAAGGTAATPADDAGDETAGSATTDETTADDPGTEPAADESAVDASEQPPANEPVESASGDGPERGGGAAGPPGSKAAGASQGAAVDRQQRDEPTPRAADTEAEPSAADAEEEASPEAETPETAVSETETAERTTGEAERTQPSAGNAESARPTARDTDSARPTTESPDTAEPKPNDAGAADAAATPVEDTTTPSGAAEPRTDQTAERAVTDERSGDGQPSPAATDSDAAGALETRSIPSLDPERSSSTPEPATAPQATETQQPAATEPATSPQTSTPQSDSATDQVSAASEPDQSRPAEPAAEQPQPEPSPELAAELEEREAEIADLEAEIRDLSAENEELAAERDRLTDELEEARAEIQRLEEELEAAGGPAPSGRALSAAEAIDGTNLFVRYHSKGEATLAKAQDGSADRASVEENLRLEYHTQFDAEDASVDGEAFETFLHDSIHYRFVDWFVRSLLYEIRDTGHESEMGVLYDALPDIDRAELNGQVSVTYTEDGQEHRSQETFDVVVRDRMGNPLVVANINDSRQPATDGQMTDIVRNAERVGNASDSLAAAFLVTSSFFEPEALETAKQATSSGLLSRDKRKSFVNLSRKGGYHLCLLEARNKEFHLAVPEL